MKKRALWGSLGLYALLAAIWWWPVVTQGSRAIPGIGGDPFQTLWRFVRLREVVTSGSLVIPEEAAIQNFGPLPWLPISALVGEVLGYTIAWFASAVLSGWCVFLLARNLGAAALPAFLAGVLVVFSPYRLSQALGHFGAMQLWWIPATLLAFLLWMKTRRPAWGILAGALTVGAAWTEHQLFLSLLLFLLVCSVAFWRRVREHVGSAWRVRLLVALIVAGAAVAPFAPTLLNVASPGSAFNLGQEQRERFSARLDTLFAPPPFSPWREGMRGYGDDTTSAADRVHTVGLVLAAAAVLSFLRGRRRRTDWALLAAACVGIALALGPSLSVGAARVPLPGAVLDEVPVLSALRTVGRFVALPALALPILLARRWSTLRLRGIGSVGLSALLVFEILPVQGYPLLPVGDPPVVAAVRELPDGAILALPAATNDRAASEHLYLSLAHGHAVAGNSALLRVQDPAERAAFIGTPVVGDLAIFRVEDFDRPSFFGQDPAAVAPAAFAAHDIRAVLYDTDPPGGVVSLADDARRVLSPSEREAVRRFLRETLGLPERQVRPGVYLYRIPAAGDAAEPVVAARGKGWRLVERSRDTVAARVDAEATFTLYAVRDVASADLAFRVRDAASADAITLEGPRASARAALPLEGTVTLPLGALAEGFSSYRLVADAPGLVIEHPRITVRSFPDAHPDRQL